jgi:hypothetical protein
MAGNYFWIIFFSFSINCAPYKKVAVEDFCLLACSTQSGGKAISAIFCNSSNIWAPHRYNSTPIKSKKKFHA